MVKLRKEKNTGNYSTHMVQNGVTKESLDLLETQLGINMVVKMVFLSNQLGICLGLRLMKMVTIQMRVLLYTTKKLDVNYCVLFGNMQIKVMMIIFVSINVCPALSIFEKSKISSKFDYFYFWEMSWILNRFQNKCMLIWWYQICWIFWISSFFIKFENLKYFNFQFFKFSKKNEKFQICKKVWFKHSKLLKTQKVTKKWRNLNWFLPRKTHKILNNNSKLVKNIK